MMRSKLRSVFALATAAAIAFGMAGASVAATIPVSGVGGKWTALMPPEGPTNVTGLNTSSVRWGTPFVGPGGTGQQSGYSFVGAAAGNIETGEDFILGTFTHNNFVIKTGTSIDGANLGVIVDLIIGGVTRSVSTAFRFNHDETKNGGESNGLCKNGAANGAGVNSAGCADRVSLSDNTASNESFEIGGLLYILEITGFTVAGQLLTEFWTTENAANSAILKARFTRVVPTDGGGGGGGEPVPSPVPLPAAGWMILSALGALSAMRMFRKA